MKPLFSLCSESRSRSQLKRNYYVSYTNTHTYTYTGDTHRAPATTSSRETATKWVDRVVEALRGQYHCILLLVYFNFRLLWFVMNTTETSRKHMFLCVMLFMNHCELQFKLYTDVMLLSWTWVGGAKEPQGVCQIYTEIWNSICKCLCNKCTRNGLNCDDKKLMQFLIWKLHIEKSNPNFQMLLLYFEFDQSDIKPELTMKCWENVGPGWGHMRF